MKYIALTAILLSCFFTQAQDNLIKQDSCLKKLSASLPSKWQLSIATNWIVIQNRDSIKAGKSKDNFAQNPVSFMYRYEAKWSDEKLKQVKQYNDVLKKEVSELVGKYNLEAVVARSNGSGLLSGSNEDETRRIASYYKEKSELEKQMVAIPVFNTQNYSLFDTFFNEKISNELYYPTSQGNEMLLVHAAVRDNLLQAN